MTVSVRLSRRALLSALAATGALAALPARAQTPGATPEATPTAGWTFVDDRGLNVELPAMPTRVLAQINAAASLWDFGVWPVGIWGPARTAGGEPHGNAGRVDLDAVTSVTEGWNEPDLERFVALNPDLIVSTTWDPSYPVIWGIYPEEVMPRVDAIAPSVAIAVVDVTIEDLIGRFEELASALGADPAAPEVAAARAAFAAATARLEAAIAAKPGLRVLVCGAYDDALWTSADLARPDLRFFADLGLEIVPTADGAPYADVSLEQAGLIEADLILFDARVDTGYPSLDETIAKVPIVARHPAVVAGQTAGWQYEYVMSYQGVADILNDLAAAIESAEVLTF